MMFLPPHSFTRCLLVTVLMLAVAGCGSSGPPAIEIDPVAASQAAMRAFDTDGDGQLVASELQAAAGLRACLPTIDANGDGAVSREEIEKRLAAYIAAAPHIEPFVCFVWHRGKPLTGAKVRLVPEPFLADDLPAATGTVGDDGLLRCRDRCGKNAHRSRRHVSCPDPLAHCESARQIQ